MLEPYTSIAAPSLSPRALATSRDRKQMALGTHGNELQIIGLPARDAVQGTDAGGDKTIGTRDSRTDSDP